MDGEVKNKMSTRCLIGRKVGNNKVEYIYCHHDGYLDGVGETLKNYYTTRDKIDKLMALGDLSALGKVAESNKDQWDYSKVNYDLCAAYRDRGEEDVDSRVVTEKGYTNIPRSENTWIEYLYLWDGEKWCYYCEDKWRAV